MDMDCSFSFEDKSESIVDKIQRKRCFILKTGVVPGVHDPVRPNINAAITNLRHYAKTVKDSLEMQYLMAMNIEEELHAGRPGKKRLNAQMSIEF